MTSEAELGGYATELARDAAPVGIDKCQIHLLWSQDTSHTQPRPQLLSAEASVFKGTPGHRKIAAGHTDSEIGGLPVVRTTDGAPTIKPPTTSP